MPARPPGLFWQYLMNLLKSLKKRLFPAPKIAPKLCTYDQQLVAVMRRVLRPDSSCIDVGSHVGDVLREMIAVAPRGKHHAFEALPHLATKLKARFSAVVHTSAVAEKSGTSEFQHVENDPGYSGLRQRIYDRPDPQITTILVPVTTIDETIPTNLKITLLKLDIEGGEYHALRGATSLIRRCRPYIAFEASHKSTGQYGVSSGDMYDLLATLGYDLSTMKRWLAGAGPITKATFAQNWLHGPDFFWFAVPMAA